MKNYLYLSLLLLFALSCNSVKNNTPTITVSIEPQRFFVEQIVGNKFKVNTIVPAGTSPEAYDPTPSQMIELGKSSLYFKVGYLGFENAWGKNLEENNVNVPIINCSNHIKLIEGDNHSIEIGEPDEQHGHHHQGSRGQLVADPPRAAGAAGNPDHRQPLPSCRDRPRPHGHHYQG